MAKKPSNHKSPISDDASLTKYAKEADHTSPISDNAAQTKYAKEMDHETPLTDDAAQTKYAREIDHSSPISDEAAQTKYAKETGRSVLWKSEKANSNNKMVSEVAVEESIAFLTNVVERTGASAATDQGQRTLVTLIEKFGNDLYKENKAFFNTKDQ